MTTRSSLTASVPDGPTADAAWEYVMTEAEAFQTARLADRVAESCGNPIGEHFHDKAWRYVTQLPSGLHAFLENYRRREPAGCCVVRGLPVDDEALGATPGHWRDAIVGTSTLRQDIVLSLCGITLGEPFGWATLQGGSIVQNVLPIPGDETRQSGYGSESLLEFHTEDGFHPNRCDYLLLFGLRNVDRVPTVVSSVRDVVLDEHDRTVLSQERYYIFPDTEHIQQLAQEDPESPALEKLRNIVAKPAPTSVLFGHQERPYMRVDLPFMRCVGDDAEAAHALDRFMAELSRVQREVVVEPGTLLVVDNYVAAHGRKSFQARYDGTDRWLKKLTVSRNLRRNLAGATSGSHRVII